MRELTILRLRDDGTCTTGQLLLGKTVLYTLEEPWLKNAVGKSCVEVGSYICKPHNWGPPYDKNFKQKDAYALQKVPGRKGVLIHKGNTTDDIEGCILVGLRPGIYKGKTAVLQSADAMKMLRGFMAKEPFLLTIQGPFA